MNGNKISSNIENKVRKLGKSKQEVTMSNESIGSPSPDEGKNGDMQVRIFNGVPMLFTKLGKTWYENPLFKRGTGIERKSNTLSLNVKSKSVASFGDTIRIGKKENDKTRIEIDADGNFRVKNRQGSTDSNFFNVMATGVASASTLAVVALKLIGKVEVTTFAGVLDAWSPIIIGSNQVHNVGVGSICIGGHSGKALNTSAQGNTIIGGNAGTLLETGEYNTCYGWASGDTIVGGDNNTCIGMAADAGAAVCEGIAIGHTAVSGGDYGIAIGEDISAATNDCVIGKNGAKITVDFDADATWVQSSDIRKKRNIKDDSLGLSFINDLKTKTFQWKPAEEHPEEWGHFKVDEDGNKVYVDMNTDIVMHGMIAQEVKEALDKAGCDTFGGWKVEDTGQQELSKEMFVIPLIKAVQELSAEVNKLKEQ